MILAPTADPVLGNDQYVLAFAEARVEAPRTSRISSRCSRWSSRRYLIGSVGEHVGSL